MELGEQFSCSIEHDTKVEVSVSLADLLRPPGQARQVKRIVALPTTGVAMVESGGRRRQAVMILDAFIRRLNVRHEVDRPVLRPTMSVAAAPNSPITRDLWRQMEEGWYASLDDKVAEPRPAPHEVLTEVFDSIFSAPHEQVVLGGRMQVAYFYVRKHGEWVARTSMRAGMRIGLDAEPRRLLRRLLREHKEDKSLALKTLRLGRYLTLVFNPPKIPERIDRADDDWANGRMPRSLMSNRVDDQLVPNVLAPMWAAHFTGDPVFARQLSAQGLDLPSPLAKRGGAVQVRMPQSAILTAHFEGLNQNDVVIEDDED
jgi:hypothetical protein